MENYKEKQFIFTQNNIEFKINYKIWNQNLLQNNAKILLCLHGVMGCSNEFIYFGNKLCNDHYVIIALDLIGRGKSTWFENKNDQLKYYHYSVYSEIIEYFIKNIIKQSNIIILGTSLGGMMGILLSPKIENYLSGFIINDIGTYISPESVEYLVNFFSKQQLFYTKKELLSNLPIFFSYDKSFDDNMLNYMIDCRYIYNEDNKIYSILADCRGITEGMARDIQKMDILNAILEDNWCKIKVPVLILRGGDSKFFPRKLLFEMINRYTGKDIKFIEYPDVGHAPLLLSNDRVKIIFNWLKNNK